jgi:hypothetical protein
MRQKLTAFLLDAQNRDGGWASGRTGRSNSEATAFALSALGTVRASGTSERIERGVTWLSDQQGPNGGFSFAGRLEPSAWVTALAVLALSHPEANSGQTLRAADWLLVQEGRGFDWLTWLAFQLMPENRRLRLNPDLKGWSWHPESFSWVEPTSYALIALKKLRPQLDPGRGSSALNSTRVAPTSGSGRESSSSTTECVAAAAGTTGTRQSLVKTFSPIPT